MKISLYRLSLFVIFTSILAFSNNALTEITASYFVNFNANIGDSLFLPSKFNPVKDPVFVSGMAEKGIRLLPGDKVLFPIGEKLKSRAGTISFWIKPETDNEEFKGCFLETSHEMGEDYFMVFKDRHRVCFRWWHPVSNDYYDANLPSNYLMDNQWNFITIKWDFDKLKHPDTYPHELYINGEKEHLNYRKNDDIWKSPSSDIHIFLGETLDLKCELFTEDKNLSICFDEMTWSLSPATNADIIANYTKVPVHKLNLIFQAEEMLHYFGKETLDKDASNGKSWTTSPYMLKSPCYALSEKGDYKAIFRVKNANKLGKDKFVSLGVAKCSDKGSFSLINELVAGSIPADSTPIYEEKEVPFTFDGKGKIMVWVKLLNFGSLDFYVDYIELFNLKDNKSIAKYEGEDLTYFIDTRVDDTEALNGRAYLNGHGLIYGPYLPLPAVGKYRADFYFKLAERGKYDELATVEVYAHDGIYDWGTGDKSYCIRGLREEHFPPGQKYICFPLEFFYDGAKMMEFRVLCYVFDENLLSIDRVEVVRLLSK